MLLHRMLRPSTARRLGSWVLLGSFCVLAASLAFIVQGARSAVQKRTGESLAALTSATANAVAARTGSVETVSYTQHRAHETLIHLV
jgi:hypothetical protein